MYSTFLRSRARPPTADKKRRKTRGQSLVEFALLLPLLLSIVLGIIEGGFLFRSYNALVAATWMGTRFALDGGSNDDVRAVIQSNASGLAVADASRTDIYVVRGKTNGGGAIPNDPGHWTAQRVFGNGTAPLTLTRSSVEQQLQAGVDGLGSPTKANVGFVAVEVAYQHRSMTGSWVFPITLTVRSNAVVQQLAN